MADRERWTRQQLLVAFWLYCQMPFGKMDQRNPQIIKFSEQIGRTPSALAMKLSNIASLDPEITSTGRVGLDGASKADKEMWIEMQADWESFAERSAEAVGLLLVEPNSEVSVLDLDAVDYSGQDKIVETKVRVGQRFFRRAVLSAYDFKCCISGLSMPDLLVASHIVPWASGSDNRLNPRNGLALSALHDKAFDIGLITINDDFTLRLSSKGFDAKDDFYVKSVKAYEGKEIARPEKFSPHLEFLAFHREHVFEKKWRSP